MKRIEQIAAIIRGELLNTGYRMSDNLRTAVMYSPDDMTTAEWVAACALVGVKANSARNRLSEVRRWQIELGERNADD